jgi:cyanophycinase
MRVLLILAAAAATAAAQSNGPAKGSLLVIGGGAVGPEILHRFGELAGCPGALIVAIPTAGESESYSSAWPGVDILRQTGCEVTVLHTRDRAEADSEAFVEPLRKAGGIFFGGGRQWRLVDSYLGTRTQREMEAVLERGGVIAGTSAGASIRLHCWSAARARGTTS